MIRKTLITAAALSVLAAATPAQAGMQLNGLNLNGLTINGVAAAAPAEGRVLSIELPAELSLR